MNPKPEYMKKLVLLSVLFFLSSTCLLAQNQEKRSKADIEACQKKHFLEAEEDHRIVNTYFAKDDVENMFASAMLKAGVAESDKEAFKHMLSEYYFYRDRNAIFEKINRNELTETNIGAFIKTKIAEYSSYYAGTFLQGKTTLLGDNAPQVKKVGNKEIESFLSSKLGTPVVMSLYCGNSDFELGNYSGWTGGNYNPSGAFNCGGTTPNPMPSPGFGFSAMNVTSDEHGLCNGGNDPTVVVAPFLPTVCPFGGTVSARIGDISNGCGAAEMRFQFVVTANNTNFTYYYAAVMYDGHGASTAPKMLIDMTDVTTGQPIGCAAYQIDATQAANPSSGFLNADPNNTMLYYKPWSAVFVPLTAYIGKTVEIHVATSDCNGTAHKGYTYFDVSCSPFQLTLNPSSFCGGSGYTITAPAGAATYSWSTSGGTFSGATNAQTATVTANGTYSVVMSAFGSACTYTLDTTVNITPTPLPIASFTANSVCTNTPMQFTDQSTANGGPALAGWSWNFGNGQTSTQQNPTTTYPNSGNFVVTLTVSNTVPCTSTYSANVTVLPTPTVVVANQGPYCPGEIVPAATFTPNPNDPNTTYQWISQNPNIGLTGSGSGTTPSFTASANSTLANMQGVVTVTPTLNGCVGPPASYTITIKPTPLVNPGPDLEFCPNVNTSPVNFNCIPGGGVPSFFWTNLNQAIGLGGSGNGGLPSFTTVNTTTNTVSATILVHAVLNNCPGPDSILILTINPNPNPAFYYSHACIGDVTNLTDESTIGTGSVVAWGWDLNNDGVFLDASNPNPPYTFQTGGWNTVGLSVTSNKGCKAQVYEQVYVNLPPNPAFVGDNLAGCPIHPVNFTESSTAPPPAILIDWSWDFGNGQTSVSQQPTTVLFYNASPTLPIYYDVSLTVTTDSGCSAKLTKNNYVMVYPQPIAGFTWDPPDADILDPEIHFYNQSVGGNGNLPIKYYLGDVFIGSQDPRNWTNLTDPIYTYNDQVPYTYYVTQWVKNIYGCKDSVTHPITILPAFTFYIPNAFSPNGDGRNEGFKGTGIGIDTTTYNLWIFDRWGNQVFWSDDLEATWNGRVNDVLVQEDTYCWKVRFHDISGNNHEYHGIVNLIR